jgi:hypothetical protein
MAISEKGFRDNLPISCTCRCGLVVSWLDWHVAQFDADALFAVCVVGCPSCAAVHVAAAGSNEEAYQHAQHMRFQLLRMVGK